MASSSAAPLQGQGDIGTFQQIRRPGKALFIVNINPKGDTGTFEFPIRKGANADSANLQMVFVNRLGFKWINADCFQDVTTQQWDHRKGNQTATFNKRDCKCLRCRIEMVDHSQSKSFVLAISTHGREITETEIIFSDGNSILLTEIFEALNDANCPTLAGKPRIIILQVCRAMYKDQKKVLSMQDKGVKVLEHSNGSGESHTEPVPGCSSGSDAPKSRFRVETVEDHSLQQFALAKMPNQYLLIYPVVSGQKAKRNVDDGSWLIHGMKKIIQKKYPSDSERPVNFLHFITQVSGFVAREMESVTYKEENETDTIPENNDQQNQTETANGSAQNKKEREKKTRDEENSGFKNAVCSYHKLTSPIIFYPNETKPVIPQYQL